MTAIKPNFLVVGAGKAGTTSLYHYLQQVDGIYLPAVKEPHYFVADEVKNRIPGTIFRRDDYLRLFDEGGNSIWRGEMSVTYLYYAEQAIPRILAELGDETRIGILLRNPIDRSHSAYLDVYRHNTDERATFEEALVLEAQRMADLRLTPMIYYKDMSLYSDRVEAYLRSFKNVHIMLAEDLREKPYEVVSEFVRFLGGLTMPANLDASVHNAGGRTWKMPIIGTWIKRAATRRIRASARRLMPARYSKIKERLFRMMMHGADPIDERVRRDLVASFEPDIARLSVLIGRDLSHWLR